MILTLKSGGQEEILPPLRICVHFKTTFCDLLQAGGPEEISRFSGTSGFTEPPLPHSSPSYPDNTAEQHMDMAGMPDSRRSPADPSIQNQVHQQLKIDAHNHLRHCRFFHKHGTQWIVCETAFIRRAPCLRKCRWSDQTKPEQTRQAMRHAMVSA